MPPKYPVAKIIEFEDEDLAWVLCPYCGKKHLHRARPDSGWKHRLRQCWRADPGGEYVIASLSTYEPRLYVLYRFYADDGGLLYVGVTKNPPARFRDHQNGKDWWRLVWLISLEHYTTRQALLAAELQAIQTEHPLHNIAGVRVD